ncbi:MAG: gfo/Idh/MocA family oxidoreductase, partial [Oscillospiraceae bacterium]|nr:gfo/Idh/MocA family oxidoreductase [Oscillospiraceae bacterium]
AVHHIDMLNWIEGKLPDSVIAMMTNVMHDNSEVEDLSVACLHYSDRSMAQITSSVVHHGEEQGIVLQCADAKLSSSWNVKAEISQSNGFPCHGGNTELKKRLDDFYNGIPDLTYEGHTGEIDDVLKALETNGSPLITGIDGRKTVEVITAIYIAGFLGHTVQLPILKEDIGYKFDDILKYAIHFYEKKEFLESLG